MLTNQINKELEIVEMKSDCAVVSHHEHHSTVSITAESEYICPDYRRQQVAHPLLMLKLPPTTLTRMPW
jgi:hypothetical protein